MLARADSTESVRFLVRIAMLTSIVVLQQLRWSLRVRQSDSGYQFDACLRDKVKLQRAHGGCSGDERR